VGAEQVRNFAVLLGDAAEFAQQDAMIALHRRTIGASPMGIASAVGQELASAAPTKATVAAALQEQVSPKETPELASRRVMEGNGDREMPVAVPELPPAPENKAARRPHEPAQKHGDGAAQGQQQRGSAASQTTTQAATAPAVDSIRQSAPVAAPSASGGTAAASRPSSAVSPTVAAIGRVSTVGLNAGRARPAALPAAPPREPTPQAQFARGLAAALRQGGGTVMLHLKPAALGDLRIRLDIRGGSVAAQFQVRTDEARRLLQETIETLRTVLEAKGLEVERLSVHLAERKEEHAAQESPSQEEGDSGQGHGGQGSRDERAAPAGMPEMEAGTEVLELSGACAELHAELGGVPRIDAIA
jgi:flagellar hook-length control protein FliK